MMRICLKYPSKISTKFSILSSFFCLVHPAQSKMCRRYRHDSSHMGAETEFNDANAPFSSRLCIGFAPGAKAHLLFCRQVLHRFLPYITLEVIVRTERVSIAFRYVGIFQLVIKTFKQLFGYYIHIIIIITNLENHLLF